MARSFSLGYRAAPLEMLLASVPTPPRAILSRLTARMIKRLGEPNDDAEVSMAQLLSR